MAISFKLYYGAVVLMRARAEIVERERNTRWVQDLVEEEAK
jgi:heme exporter protein C